MAPGDREPARDAFAFAMVDMVDGTADGGWLAIRAWSPSPAGGRTTSAAAYKRRAPLTGPRPPVLVGVAVVIVVLMPELPRRADATRTHAGTIDNARNLRPGVAALAAAADRPGRVAPWHA